MALAVETFDEIELVGATAEVADDAEAVALIDQLGLSGQRKLVSRKGSGGEAVCPYRKVTREEAFVIGTICPQYAKLQAYEAGPIPLRVLQVAAHAETFFRHLWVLSPAEVVKDPFLLGSQSEYEYSPWSDPGKVFLLARWGAELAPWSELRAKAAQIFRAKYRAALAKCRASLEIAERQIADISDAIIVTQGGSFPNVNGLLDTDS